MTKKQKAAQHCFWCGGKLKGPVPWQLNCETCGAPPFTPEEYMAMKHGRKPARPTKGKNDDQTQ